MNRRGFLTAAISAAVGALAFDPEKALWLTQATHKSISIPQVGVPVLQQFVVTDAHESGFLFLPAIPQGRMRSEELFLAPLRSGYVKNVTVGEACIMGALRVGDIFTLSGYHTVNPLTRESILHYPRARV